MRFFAAFSVMLFHYSYLHNASRFAGISEITKYGYLGVHLFFIISGFVIFFSVQKANPIGFVISRMVRLYPAYWFCLSITFLVILFWDPVHSHNFKVYLINLTMLQGFFGIANIDGSYWSLGIEISFYLLMFFLIVFQQIKNSLFIFGCWILLTLVLTFKHIKYLHLFVVPEYSSFFIAGAVFYLIRRDQLCLNKAALITACYFLSLFHTIRPLFIEPNYNSHVSGWMCFFCVTFFYALFILLSLQKISVSNSKVYALLGDITFPLYLIHQKVGIILFDKLQNYVNQYLSLFLVIFSMLIISVFISRVIEKKASIVLRDVLLFNLMWIKKLRYSRFRKKNIIQDEVVL